MFAQAKSLAACDPPLSLGFHTTSAAECTRRLMLPQKHRWAAVLAARRRKPGRLLAREGECVVEGDYRALDQDRGRAVRGAPGDDVEEVRAPTERERVRFVADIHAAQLFSAETRDRRRVFGFVGFEILLCGGCRGEEIGSRLDHERAVTHCRIRGSIPRDPTSKPTEPSGILSWSRVRIGGDLRPLGKLRKAR